MRKPEVVIIDYGMGNLLSVQRGFERVGGEVSISADPEYIRTAERVVLPGVGAFPQAMDELNRRGLTEVIQEISFSGTPLLGICLGMQLLMDESEEFGLTKGLGIFAGRVQPMKTSISGSLKVKKPHIGWSSIEPAAGTSWKGTILESTAPGDAVYFVHSYMSCPVHQSARLAECVYGENNIAAVIHSESVFGCQFHPEKSGGVGLEILKSFLNFKGRENVPDQKNT